MHDNCTDPPIKRWKSDYATRNQELMESPQQSLRQVESSSCIETPKPEKMESQESPLDFSRKSGSDSSSSSLSEPNYSKPGPSTFPSTNEVCPAWNLTSKSPDNPSLHKKILIPAHNGFSCASDVSPIHEVYPTLKSARESSDNSSHHKETLLPVHNGFSDSSISNHREDIGQMFAEIHKPQPTKIPINRDSAHWLEKNGTRSDSAMSKYLPEYQKNLNAKNPFKTGLNGFSSQMNSIPSSSNECFYGRPYSHYSTNLGYQLTSTRPTNSSLLFSFSAMGAATDKKFAKNNRPFKVLENEILGYDPVNPCSFNPVSFHSPKLVETSQLSPVISPQARNGNHDVVSSPERNGHSNSSGEDQDGQNDYSDESQITTSQLALLDGHQSDSSCTRKKGQKFPDELKDKAYYDKRRKNNEAAKRSRDARRRKEDEIALRAKNLLDHNKELQYKLMNQMNTTMMLQKENENLKMKNYAINAELDNVRRELEIYRQHVSLNGGMSRENSKEIDGENRKL